MTDPEREDKYILPPPGTEWKLEPEEDERLFMVKDHSLKVPALSMPPQSGSRSQRTNICLMTLTTLRIFKLT